jgi:hypothetical protein
MRRNTKACTKQPAKSRTDMKRLTREVVIPSPNNIASIYEKVPLYKVVQAWDNNHPNLSEVYKLQSNDPQKKVALKSIRIMENMVLNLPSIKQSLSLTRELKNVTSTGWTLLWSLRMCSRAIITQPGNRCFTSTPRA